MILASYANKQLIVDLLTRSFEDNKSVNYIIKQDLKKIARIRSLMAYSFEVCYRWGKVYLSNDYCACALLLLPGKKKGGLKSILLDITLMFSSISPGNIPKVLRRAAKIEKLQIKDPSYYIWFIAVEPDRQSQGVGSTLLLELIDQAQEMKLPVTLETSTLANLPWYKKFGFSIYNQLDIGYVLYFLIRKQE